MERVNTNANSGSILVLLGNGDGTLLEVLFPMVLVLIPPEQQLWI
ncbi:MAG: hypothetical protein AB8V23_03410 [Candidatus Midichloria sp.]|uniref:Uncharacterized protein n=1 Tax=Hyalomma marginatum TaxID=34627 RepID=A0A8S4C1P8_9ACAR|nr:hypothetical protein MHYMCMPASI_00546 [Hyalomma marginatum]CAG7592798.1 hypothetical protein MHYMCMPSP_00734 [Hyalomma marginatum]